MFKFVQLVPFPNISIRAIRVISVLKEQNNPSNQHLVFCTFQKLSVSMCPECPIAIGLSGFRFRKNKINDSAIDSNAHIFYLRQSIHRVCLLQQFHRLLNRE
jgi:hypothetical protein